MRIKILSLTLQCRQSREIINFSSHITYIHGQISAGKSSILRLIDYCLGGSLEKTIAITRELVNVELRTQIGEYEVLFEREVEGSNWVQVTWRRDNGDFSSVLAPIKVSRESKAIWNTDIYNLSDLIFHLAGITPIKVRKSKQAEDSDLVRLSIRDMLWYCYLEQDNLDSSFYNLADPFRKLKSRDVMRFVTGFYTERMNELEIELDQVTDERYAKQEAAKQIRQFLQDFGYAGESEIQAEIEKAQKQLTELNGQQYSIRQEYSSSTHLADELREQLRALSERLDQENSVLKDLVERINEQEALKAELVTAKFKLARSESASAVLSGIRFESCPSCGTDLQTLNRTSPDMCNLCGSQLTQSSDDLSLRASVISQDLSSRIEDLDESISHHSRARTIQQKRIEQLRYEKGLLDSKLTQVLADYDSAYLARSREVERQTATLEERIRNLGQTLRMFDAVQDLEKTSELLRDRQLELRQEIEAEKNKLGQAEERITEIERSYKEALLEVAVPGVNDDDNVQINLRTWIPWISPKDGDSYNFWNAGSGGKKTLLNVCYALAVHKVAADYGLPLPTFLMIDTPMKNIGEDVNKNIFHAFYTYLYKLAAGSLSGTQFIIVDKEYFPPPENLELEITSKFMSPDNPLISYYRGP